MDVPTRTQTFLGLLSFMKFCQRIWLLITALQTDGTPNGRVKTSPSFKVLRNYQVLPPATIAL